MIPKEFPMPKASYGKGKTLKQFYEEEFEERLKKQLWMNMFDIFRVANIKWLTQKLQESEPQFTKNQIIKELLEEFNQQ